MGNYMMFHLNFFFYYKLFHLKLFLTISSNSNIWLLIVLLLGLFMFINGYCTYSIGGY
jgi:hypothetical protein